MTDGNENKQRTWSWVPEVPQLYYEIIARLIPGAVILGTFVFAAAGPGRSLDTLGTWLGKPAGEYPSIIIFLGLGLVFSYVLGTILWGLWFLLSLFKRWLLWTRKVDRGTGIPEKEVGDFHMKYDYIKLKDTTIGNRISKLKAQIHMCGGLITGIGLSLLINVIAPLVPKNYADCFDTSRWVFGISLLVAMVGSCGAWNHFVHHIKTEVEDNARLLDWEKEKRKFMMGLTLLFDFDGTLVDIDKLQAYERLVKKHSSSGNSNLARTLYEEDIKLCKQGRYDRAEVFGNHTSEFPGASVEQLCQYFWEEVTRTQRIKEGCHDTLEKLQAHGHTLVCITDADGQGGNKFRRIAATGLDNYFERIFIGGGNVPFRKGIIKYLDHIVKELDVNRKRCVVIGDKVEIDLEPAKKIGMSSILVINKEYPGDWPLKVESLPELIPIIEKGLPK